jgi:AcrR family transcriptional regulator
MARPKSDIEPRILAAARARFLSDGVDGASLRGIASDAGTSIGMVYYYFATKDELFFGVVEELYGKLLQDIEVAIAPDVSVRERAERLFARVARVSDDEALVMRLVLREALTSNTRFARLRERFRTGHVPLIARLIADGYASGAFDRNVHPMVTMLSFAGFVVCSTVSCRFPMRPPEKSCRNCWSGCCSVAREPPTVRGRRNKSVQGPRRTTVQRNVVIRPPMQSALASMTRLSEAFDRSAADVVRLGGAPSAAETAETVRISPEARQAGTSTDTHLTSGLEGAMTDMRVAKYAFIASLKVLQVCAEVEESAANLLKPKT